MGICDDIEYQTEIKGIISLCNIHLDLIKLYDSLNELHQTSTTTSHDEITPEVICYSCLILELTTFRCTLSLLTTKS